MNIAKAIQEVGITNQHTAERGPLYWSEAQQLERLLRTKAVKAAAKDGYKDAETFEEAVYHATRRWTLADLCNAATAAVFQAEDRHDRQWIWYSRMDMQGELARAVVQCLIKQGWQPTDM